jgi:hypothetical protein
MMIGVASQDNKEEPKRLFAVREIDLPTRGIQGTIEEILEDPIAAADCVVLCCQSGEKRLVLHLTTLDKTSGLSEKLSEQLGNGFLAVVVGGSEDEYSKKLGSSVTQELAQSAHTIKRVATGGSEFKRVIWEGEKLKVNYYDPRTYGRLQEQSLLYTTEIEMLDLFKDD